MNLPVPSATAHQGQTAKYLTFRLQRESYALPVMQVCEIIRLQGDVTTVPGMPAYVRGVINLRGKVIPVIDLRARFQLRDGCTDSGQTCTIVVLSGGSRLGLMVDGVEEVSVIPPNDVTPPPHFGGDRAPDFLLGMARTPVGVKCLLDLDRILCRETLAKLSTLETGA